MVAPRAARMAATLTALAACALASGAGCSADLPLDAGVPLDGGIGEAGEPDGSAGAGDLTTLPPDLACGRALSSCASRCTNTAIDPDHCGGCGRACGPGTRCSGGRCAVPCALVGLPDPPLVDLATAPGGIAVADFNRDGRLDLAVALSAASSVVVLPGVGHGSFGEATGHPVGIGPEELATADLDGDGDADLVVANRQNATIGVLLNSGGGAFAPMVRHEVSPIPVALALADFDGDGRADIAVLNLGDNTISVLRGTGNGGFAAPQVLPAAGAPIVSSPRISMATGARTCSS